MSVQALCVLQKVLRLTFCSLCPQDAVGAVAQLPGLQAVLLNCCAPQAVTAALPCLRAAAERLRPGLRVGGYANGFCMTTSQWLAGEAANGEGHSADAGAGGAAGAPVAAEAAAAGGALVQPPAEEYDSEGMILPGAYARHAAAWRAAGAGVVGGCCGVGPQHIARIRQELDGVCSSSG